MLHQSFLPASRHVQEAPPSCFVTSFSLRPAGEVFTPYYYGRAIDSIVVHQSMEYLARPVLTVLALSVCR